MVREKDAIFSIQMFERHKCSMALLSLGGEAIIYATCKFGAKASIKYSCLSMPAQQSRSPRKDKLSSRKYVSIRASRTGDKTRRVTLKQEALRDAKIDAKLKCFQ